MTITIDEAAYDKAMKEALSEIEDSQNPALWLAAAAACHMIRGLLFQEQEEEHELHSEDI